MATVAVPPPPLAGAAIEAARSALRSAGGCCGRAGVVECRYEAWPFDTVLPRIERGRVVLPADAPGARSFRCWEPGDGIELPVRSRGLQLGRFVVVARNPSSGVSIPASWRSRALDIADECGAALVASLDEGAGSWPTC